MSGTSLAAICRHSSRAAAMRQQRPVYMNLRSPVFVLHAPPCHVAAVLSWPGLVDTYLSYMHKEVAEHKKQLDATALKVFKTIFTAADNTDRCGESTAAADQPAPALSLAGAGYMPGGPTRAPS